MLIKVDLCILVIIFSCSLVKITTAFCNRKKLAITETKSVCQDWIPHMQDTMLRLTSEPPISCMCIYKLPFCLSEVPMCQCLQFPTSVCLVALLHFFVLICGCKNANALTNAVGLFSPCPRFNFVN